MASLQIDQEPVLSFTSLVSKVHLNLNGASLAELGSENQEFDSGRFENSDDEWRLNGRVEC